MSTLEARSLEVLTLYHMMPTFKILSENFFENTDRKKENAGTQHFLLSSNVFQSFKCKNHHLKYFYSVTCKCFKLGQSKVLSFGKELSKLSQKVFRVVVLHRILHKYVCLLCPKLCTPEFQLYPKEYSFKIWFSGLGDRWMSAILSQVPIHCIGTEDSIALIHRDDV